MSLIHIPREHRVRVSQQLADGSDPRGAFFLMTGVSTLIAAFGLLMDSTAVVIGAMLVAPLMTPILGIALALVQGNPRLLGHAVRAEATGMVVAVGVAAVLGATIPFFETTPEMLSRTSPNLFDLMVALFAGLAGAYALADEKLSPALPGVAISTAIVPPLANTGLCLSLGAFEGAYGSALLFFTNFLTILLVSSLVFWLCGMGSEDLTSSKLTLARRFGVAVVGFLVLGGLLGRNLVELLGERRLQHQIRRVLAEELASYRISELDRLTHRPIGDEIAVLAHVHSPRLLSPRQVRVVEGRLEDRLGRPCELYLRMTLTRNVSATGSIDRRFAETLDGFSFTAGGMGSNDILLVAEQAIREYLGEKVGQKLVELQAFPWEGEAVLLAEVTGVRKLRRTEVGELRAILRARVDERIKLGVRQGDEVLTEDGPVRFEFATRRPGTPEEKAREERITQLGDAWLADAGYIPVNSSQTILSDGVHVLFEVCGPRDLTPEQVGAFQDSVRDAVGTPVHAYVRVVPEVVVTDAGQETFDGLLDRFGQRVRREYEAETQALIEAWR